MFRDDNIFFMKMQHLPVTAEFYPRFEEYCISLCLFFPAEKKTKNNNSTGRSRFFFRRVQIKRFVILMSFYVIINMKIVT